MQKTIEVVSRLVSHGIIKQYAIAGAVAALNYIDPFLTEDLDILIDSSAFQEISPGLVTLTPIEAALAAMGYAERKDVGIVIEGWPVQFLPVADTLDEESLSQAIDVEFEGPPPFTARVLRAEHVVAKAISVGRSKDLARVVEFLTLDAVNMESLRSVLERHALMSTWKAFCLRTGRPDPLALS